MIDRETSNRMHKIAESEFPEVVNRLNTLTGWYTVVQWYPNGVNPIWITGPYESKERAAVDADFFRVSGSYGPILQSAVAGSDPPKEDAP
jgi:hypothetical protein